jgi:hypothetical protein
MDSDFLRDIAGFVVIIACIVFFAPGLVGGVIGLAIAFWRLPSEALKAIKRRRSVPRKTHRLLTYPPAYVTFPYLLAGMGAAKIDLGDLIRKQPPVSEGGMSEQEAWNLLAFCGWIHTTRGEEAAAELLKVAAAHYDRRSQSAEGTQG